MIKNLQNDYLFPDFITSGEPEIDNQKILHECYLVKQDDPGLNKSNVYGYHSDLFEGSKTLYENLNHLSHQALEFANQVLAIHRTNQKISKMTWWVNINPEYSYNILHSHPKADLSVVYYARVAEESGSLILMRSDGAIHTSLFAKQPQALRFEVKPVVGRFYAFPAHVLHQVLNNLSHEDRVSIAFNMTI